MSNATPSSEDLETYLAIIEAGSLSAAARALRQPKSTLSRRLARLEDVLGVRLLVRNRQRLEPSEAGSALLGLAREALSTLKELANAADRRRGVPEGLLRVSVPVDIVGMKELWLGFSEAFPGVALEIVPSNRYVDLVAERFDLALRGGRGPDESLVARPVGRYRLIAVASPGYLDRWGLPDQPASLRRHSCFLFCALGHKPGHPSRPELPHRHIICPDEGTALEGARRGLGIAILRDGVVQADLDAGALVPVLHAYNPLVVPLYAVFPERSYLRAAVIAFIDYVSARLG